MHEVVHLLLGKQIKLGEVGDWEINREEKSLRLVAMEAKFLDDNKPISYLNFTDLIQFHLIWQISAKFSLATYLSLSKFRK